MYSRPFKKTPKTIVHNGIINFGAFDGVTDKLDIRGVRAPFAGIPTSRFLSNFRIKSKLSYTFNTEKYIGLIEFFDDKAFGLAEVIFWNKETNQKFAYHTFMGPRRRFVPTNTYEGVCTSFSKKRYIKITWNRNYKKLAVSFSVCGDKFKPSAKAKFYSRIHQTPENEVLFVTPAPTTQRCSATWFVPLSILGGLETAEQQKDINSISHNKGQALLKMNRTYLKAHSSSEALFGFLEANDKQISFSFSNTNQDSYDEDNYNENMLSVDGKITCMPPVCITHSYGISNKWIIQDTENMVDLSFTPISISNRILNIIIMRNTTSTIYGTFDGVLISESGEKILLKNTPGIVKKSALRL